MLSRTSLHATFLLVALVGCGGQGAHAQPDVRGGDAGFVTNQRIAHSDGLHNENTAMLALDDRILLAFRGGETAQIGSSRAHIDVYASKDGGRTLVKQSEIHTDGLPDGRDIRDPKLVEVKGRLFLYAISRLPGGHYRDLSGQAWTVRAESTDRGATWSAPVKTFEDVDASGTETFWGFWRFTKRTDSSSAEARETLYATGYDDGDTRTALFASDDGISWAKRATILDSEDDVPSEAELQFFGAEQETAVAIVRLDNQDVLENGQSAVCTAKAPFTSWECGRRIEQRLDGPTWIVRQEDGRPRNFVFARKHLPCTFKRTAAYELRGDLANPAAPIEVCEIQELESSGDTSYTSVAPASAGSYLLSWYSNPVDRDLPWLQGTYSSSDIWIADLDFGRAPSSCIHPPPKRACSPPPLPPGGGPHDVTGRYLLSMAPVIWPAQLLYFQADVRDGGATLDISLQPLDQMTNAPVGSPWTVSGVAIAGDGTFKASFDSQPLPVQAFSVLQDPLLTVHDFTLTGKTVSTDEFCGSVSGYSQVFGSGASDRIRLEGSTFGAVRMPQEGGALPAPVITCAGR